MKNKITTKIIRVFFSVLLTLLIFYLIFSRINISKVIFLIKKSDFRLILLTFGLSLFSNFFIASYRWRAILKEFGFLIPLKELIFIKIGSDPFISVLPFRSGEISKLVYLQKVNNIPYLNSLYSVLAELILNVLALLFFFISGLFFLKPDLSHLNIKVLPFYLSGFFKKKNNMLGRSLLQFKKIAKNKNIIFLSFLYMFIELVNVYLLNVSLSARIPFLAVMTFIPLVIIISALPVAVGGLGLREGIIIIFFSQYSSLEVLISLGLLYSLVEYILPTIIGLSMSNLFLSRIIKKSARTKQ